MDIRPILSTLRRHKTAAALIVLEIALSCAIICNAVFLITQRLERMQRPTGMADTELVRINLAGIGENENAEALVKQDIAALRALPGVKAATSLNHVPFDSSSWNSSVNLQPDQPMPSLSSAIYLGENLVESLGLRIVEGRDFTPDEYVDWEALSKPGSKLSIPAVIITREVARKLFPGESAVENRFVELLHFAHGEGFGKEVKSDELMVEVELQSFQRAFHHFMMVHDHGRQRPHGVPVDGFVELGFSWYHLVKVHQRIIAD